VTISRSRLSGNRAELEAGGILIFGDSLILRDSLVSHNEASITSGVGGGLFVLNGSLPATARIFGSSFRENEAVGGGAITNTATLTIDHSTLEVNRAVRGGGIQNDGTLGPHRLDYRWQSGGGGCGNLERWHGEPGEFHDRPAPSEELLRASQLGR
jgi:hypothetical protein